MIKGRQKRCPSMDLLIKIVFVVGILNSLAIVASGSGSSATAEEAKEKVLIIMLDGFRWDYVDMYRSSLSAFSSFLSDGVQAEWVKPIFPSVSYPSWTTISTGVFSETHGIVGNYMFDLQESDPKDALFDLGDNNSTSKIKWWQNSEPIWTTATKHNKKTFLRYWSRCEVPFEGISPFECTGYDWCKGVECIRDTFSMAAQKLNEDFDLVMVYGEHIDNTGHKYGPNSPEMKEALIGVDGALQELLNNLDKAGLSEKVNIVIVSDHGMAGTGADSGVKYINLGDYLEEDIVDKSIDRGPIVSIAPLSSKHYQAVYDRLKLIPGTDVYKREDIPEEYHYKNARLVQEILLVAKKNYVIRGLQSDKQIPRDTDPTSYFTGLHGYDTEDMRTIFFAKGPAFKKGIVHPAIHLEDEYQIFAKLLNIPAQPHNGSWSRVSEMFNSGAGSSRYGSDSVLSILSTLFLLCIFYLFSRFD